MTAVARALLAAGAFAVAAGAVASLPAGTADFETSIGLGDHLVVFRLDPEALWLAAFGFLVAAIACAVRNAERGSARLACRRSARDVGALGVLGLQDGVSFLIAWEMMSLGGACMLLGERMRGAASGESALFMLGLLESRGGGADRSRADPRSRGGDVRFRRFHRRRRRLSPWLRFVIGLLIVVGFGAKLGLLPFYEWFPGAYASGSGATGVLLSGIVLNAAYFALARGLSSGCRPASCSGRS